MLVVGRAPGLSPAPSRSPPRRPERSEDVPINGYYTTAEAAQVLGLAAGSVRDAVRRGAICAEQIARRTLIPAHELDRYRQEIQGTHGWQTRKEPGYRP